MGAFMSLIYISILSHKRSQLPLICISLYLLTGAAANTAHLLHPGNKPLHAIIDIFRIKIYACVEL